jgi:triacylglycerol lipase
VRTSKGEVRVGALALAMVLGAVVVTALRHCSASADSSTSLTTSPSTRDTAADRTPNSAFTGRPTTNTKVAVSVLRAVSGVTDFFGVDFGTQIAPMMAFDHPPPFVMSGLDVQRGDFADQPTFVIRPDCPSGKYVVAFHGGAYVVQPTINHWSAYAAIARHTHATVVVPIYPLASTLQGRAKIVIPDMADLISAQITRHGADNVSVYGDSAGGGMALSVTQLLVSRRNPTPSHMVLISPWLDVTMSNPAIASIEDPVLRIMSLRTAGEQWAGNLSLTDPWVSPIYGSLVGLPPTAVYCGNLDLLSADVLRLREQALTAEASQFTFVLRNGAIHDWAMGGVFSTPESAAVQRDIYQQLGLTAPSP